jgi:hypothetical protein
MAALWVYGHQSPTSEHNCKDIEAMVGFDTVGVNRGQVLSKAQSVNARGYTPLTDSIRLAAADVGKEPGARTVVLVSDGKFIIRLRPHDAGALAHDPARRQSSRARCEHRDRVAALSGLSLPGGKRSPRRVDRPIFPPDQKRNKCRCDRDK